MAFWVYNTIGMVFRAMGRNLTIGNKPAKCGIKMLQNWKKNKNWKLSKLQYLWFVGPILLIPCILIVIICCVFLIFQMFLSLINKARPSTPVVQIF